jgi:hypothetical protein
MHSVLGQIKSVLAAIRHNPAAAAAVVAAMLAFVSGVLGPLVQLSIGKRQAAAAKQSADAAQRGQQLPLSRQRPQAATLAAMKMYQGPSQSFE